MQSNILHYFEKGAALEHPDKIAIVDGAVSYTFAELERLAKRCAACLIARADVLHQPIAVFLPKSASVVIADLGIAYSGNIYTNLDTKSPLQRLKNILASIVPHTIITSRDLIDTLLAAGMAADQLFCIDDVDDDRVVADNTILWKRLAAVIDTDPLCLINTSGSTGTPKSVVLSHRGTIDFMDWVFATFDLGSRAVIGSLSPFHFDIFTLELNLCLAKGATLVIIPEPLAIFPVRLLEYIAREQVTFLFWVPSIMVNIANLGLLEKLPLPALTDVFFAGEVFPTRHLNQWRRALPVTRFVNLYGPIEIHVDCTYFVVDRLFDDDQPLPIGFACRNTDILLLNDSNGLCQSGEQGELCVRGSSLALGYWNDPDKTAKAFVQNPLNSRYPELIYRTGDLAWRSPAGEIYLAGRKDFQIKHMGYRIELSEIEHQVLCITGIANACVLYQHENKEITLFYQSLGEPVTSATIRQKLAEIFPKYMLPTVFHPMDRLPQNANGKIDRNALSLSIQQGR